MNAPPPELWVFRGTQPVIWRIPVKVTVRKPDELSGKARLRSSVRAHFTPAIHLLDCQHRALDNFFASQKIIELSPAGHWRLKIGFQSYHRRLEKMGGIRAVGNDPEEYLVWGARRPPMTGVDEDNAERRAWLEEMVARGGGESVEQLAYQWRAFCLHIAHTLINKEQSVDCYFFKLHNCPLRAGWHRSLRYNGRVTNPTRKLVVRKICYDSRLLAFAPDIAVCLRRIELQHKPDWWKLIRKIEQQRWGRLGQFGYERYFTKSIREWSRPAWEIYQDWLAEMAQRRPERSDGGPDRRVCFVPEPVAWSMRGKAYSYRETVDGVSHWAVAVPKRRRPLKIPGADGGVPSVPDIRPKAKDVRKSQDERRGPAVDQPGDGPRGSDGVLVRDAVGCVVSNEAVLAPRTGIDGQGVAPGT